MNAKTVGEQLAGLALSLIAAESRKMVDEDRVLRLLLRGQRILMEEITRIRIAKAKGG